MSFSTNKLHKNADQDVAQAPLAVKSCGHKPDRVKKDEV
jgi:hypothetical protein